MDENVDEIDVKEEKRYVPPDIKKLKLKPRFLNKLEQLYSERSNNKDAEVKSSSHVRKFSTNTNINNLP